MSHSTSLPGHGQHLLFLAVTTRQAQQFQNTWEMIQPGSSSITTKQYVHVLYHANSSYVYMYLPIICSTALVSNQQNIIPSSDKTANTVENQHNSDNFVTVGKLQRGPDRAVDTWYVHFVSHARSRLQPVCLPSPHCRSMRQASISLLVLRLPHHSAIGHTCHQYSMIG